MTAQQIKKDWEYINDKYGSCEDMCGDICNEELFIGLLKGSITKTECFIHIMQRYYDTGTEEGKIPESDTKAKRIFDKWLREGLIK
jgi:hypothetical protein